MSIKNRISILVSLLLTVLLLAAGIAFSDLAERDLRRSIATQQIALVDTLARSFDQQVEARHDALGAVAQSLPLQIVADPLRLQKFLDDQVVLRRLFTSVLIYSADGTVLAATPLRPNFVGVQLGAYDYLIQTRETGQPQISKVFVSRLSGEPLVVMTSAVRDAAGKVVAIVGGSQYIRQDNLFSGFTDVRVGATGTLALVTRERVVVAHPDRSRVMEQIAPGASPGLEQALRNTSFVGEAVNSRGVPALMAYQTMKTTGWIAAASLPLAEAYAPIVALRRDALRAAIVLAAALPALIWISMHMLTRPLQALRDHIRAMAADPGNAALVEQTGADEIGELALAFNELTVARRQAEERLRQAARVFESTSEGIMLTDVQGTLVAVNRAFADITGYGEAEALGRNPRILKSGRHDAAFFQGLWQRLLEHGQWRGEVWNRRRNGDVYPAWLTLSTVKDAAGGATHYVGVFSDISQFKEAQQRLDFLAHHDALTQLPNRALFYDRLEHGLERARRDSRPLALLFLDLDRFKNINDTLGHPAGDELLRAVARRLSDELRASDTLARLGGDEFVLLLEDDASAHRAALVARRLLELFSGALVIGGHDQVVTVSIGISLYPGDGDDAGVLLQHADRAMYEAKSRGRNTYQFFEPSLSAGVQDRLAMENALRSAVGRGELVLHYQPQIDIDRRALVGVEALVRWLHPGLGLVPPMQFIPLAEDMGIIGEIGAWVLREACRQMVAWDRQGLAVPRIAVNLSVQQIERGTLLDAVKAALADSGLAALRLELELTESMMIRLPRQTEAALQQLLELGVHLSVDDFGTGYSSLAFLKRVALHRLKIDQSFVQDIGRNANSEAIIRAVIALAKSLGLESVAEGVEETGHESFLRREGCAVAQGYLYGRAVPAAELLARWRVDSHAEPGDRGDCPDQAAVAAAAGSDGKVAPG